MRPIAIVVLIVSVFGLKAAQAEVVNNEELTDGAHLPIAAPKFEPSSGDAADFALALPSERSAEPADEDAGEGDSAAQPPQAPADASFATEPEQDAGPSLDALCNAVLVSAESNDLPVPFFANLIWQESRLQLDSISRAGALGIAQFMPNVAAEIGLDDPFDPQQAIPASAQFLHALREHFGNLGYVAAAYNAGTHRVQEWLDHQRALPQETQTYVVRVTGRSIEAWRKSPMDDWQLKFVRRLPCRELPAFAGLEQAQMQAALLMEEQQPAQPPRQEVVLNRAPAAPPRKAKKVEKRTRAERHPAAERKERVKVTHAASTEKNEKNAHSSHGEGRGASRRQHAPHESPHEKRRVALKESAIREGRSRI